MALTKLQSVKRLILQKEFGPHTKKVVKNCFETDDQRLINIGKNSIETVKAISGLTDIIKPLVDREEIVIPF